ncbi:MAG: nitronate monooxygenase [Hydrogenophilaceae bacterium]|jgi:nitronate monooxygenase|nr:nitronate monooxygenase [Hydrogenophilaceae bacterium]
MRDDRRVIDLFGIELPILQAPMAGAQGPDLAAAVCEAGGLGALPCAMLTPEDARAQIGVVRQRTQAPLNLNFFVHRPPAPDLAREAAWRERLLPYYQAYGVSAAPVTAGPARAPFDAAWCELVEQTNPAAVSFHFGLPEAPLLQRVRASGAKIIACATTVAEARHLEARGVDAIIAQGAEAGGHRGVFLSEDIASQPGLFALLPQVVDAVKVPVIAAGGIGDGRAIAAAFVLGAAGVQIGTAYLFTPEATISPLHRAALADARDDATALTNVFTGRPARSIINRMVREVGPMNAAAPAFPLAAHANAPLRAAAEKAGSADFSPLWSGQAAALGRAMGAGDLTRTLWREAQAALG